MSISPAAQKGSWLDLKSTMSAILFGLKIECPKPSQSDSSSPEDRNTAYLNQIFQLNN